MPRSTQQLKLLEFDDAPPPVPDATASTFANNMKRPVHRWFRYSAGFSALWAQETIEQHLTTGSIRVLDPFVGSGTTLLAAQAAGAESIGVEAHPFVARIARAKLSWQSDPAAFVQRAQAVRRAADKLVGEPVADYPKLIHACYDQQTLKRLDGLRRAYEQTRDDTPTSELVWLALVSSLRRASHVNTAQWQYVLPKKTKKVTLEAFSAFNETVRMFHADMLNTDPVAAPRATLLTTDARTCEGIADRSVNLVVTSPPYPNNYDYADATRLEMSFMREISGWGDLQASVRSHLIRSCTQHVPERSVDLERVLEAPELASIATELRTVCHDLATIRESKGGRKTYHLMIACYFKDLALTWRALSRVCTDSAKVCFVIGDSAPYGVYTPVIPWMGALATAAGFSKWSFEKTRDRNVKWKNRKHRVPLQEGRLWVER